MCGRYATTRNAGDLAFLFEADDETDVRIEPDYNVAPTDPVPIVRLAPGRVLSVARWGLVPPWAKDVRGAARMINARSETVSTSPAYARAFARRRCLVPADGWYEWVRTNGRKQPYFMTRRDGGVLAFAGLWSVWGDGLLTCSVLTAAAVGDLAMVHDRMPVLLPAGRWDEWLAGQPDPDRLVSPELIDELEIRPVGVAVGDVRNDGPDLIAAVPAVPLTIPPVEPADLTLF